MSPILLCLLPPKLAGWWPTPTHKVARIFSHVVLRDHVTNQTISPLSQRLWPPNLAGWWQIMRNSHSHSDMIIQSRRFVRSLNTWPREVAWQIKNISPLSQYLRSPNLSGWWHATRSPHIVIWPFNHVVLWGHMTNEIYRISICRRPMTTQLDNVLSYHERLPPLKSYDQP